MTLFRIRVLALPVLTSLFAQAAFAQVAIDQVPRDTDSSNQAGWWRPIVVNGNTTYVAFNSPVTTDVTLHNVKVGMRSSTGTWTFGVLRNADGSVWAHEDDIGHDQPTIAVDGAGYIHVWADHHGSGWRYFRSTTPGDPTNLLRANGMPDVGKFTYIVAETAPNGDIYMMARDQEGSPGRGQLYHFNNASRAWRKVANFAGQAGAVVYPDALKVDRLGNVHIAFEWANSFARPLRHYGSYLKYEASTGNFKTVNNAIVTLPVTLSTPNLFYQPLGVGEVFNNSDTGIGIQSAAITVDGLERPSIAYRYRTDGGSNALDFDVYRVRWNGSGWVDRVKVFTASDNVPAALGHTHNGTRVRVYFTTTTQGLMAAENTSNWAARSIASGRSILRLSAVPRTSTDDAIYAAAPTAIDANTGSLYVVDVGNLLP